jgi:4-hydroxy-2-oxoheptanedioate aldolase
VNKKGVEGGEFMERNLKDLEMKCIKYGVSGFKAGTEAEKQSIEDIIWLSTQVPHLPIIVKIGGAEDNNSLKQLYHFGFRNFVAPLIETPFAVNKFATAASWVSRGHPEVLTLSLNLESLNAFEKIDDILSCADIKFIQKINIGKSDLADSLGPNIDANGKEVLQKASIMIEKAKRAGKITGVGGSIDVSTIEEVLSITNPDEFETRNVVFSVRNISDPVQSVRFAIELESGLIADDESYHQQYIDDDRARRASLEKRSALPKSVLLSV